MGRSVVTMVIASAVAACASSAARAIDLEKLAMPGPVIQGHADVEGECRRCHAPFAQGAENALCLECHEAVGSDLKRGEGFHGRSPVASARPCRSCHAEHRGRDADILDLTSETFDHSLTDYPLVGAHLAARCAQCHAAGEKHRDVETGCFACHREEDVHRGQMGEDCVACHSESAWGETRFDHSETRFALQGQHLTVACGACHLTARYEDAATACRDCHVVDDTHRGRFGTDCNRCHTPEGWRQATFDHAKTDFPLRGRHADVPCKSCHPARTPGVVAQPLGKRCVSCHRVDDVHRGRYGDDCGSCHDSRRWKQVSFDHQRKTGFGLAGAHEQLSCARCHPGRMGEEALPKDCHGCHTADDVHQGQQGDDCGRCHGVRSWTANVAFDHDLTRFPLLGLHGVVPCEDCHEGPPFRGAPLSCQECHSDRNVHDQTLGPQCASCHNPNGWALWRFDHARRTSFALHGAHEGLACGGCHKVAVAETPKTASVCEACHGMEDPHRGSFGPSCSVCHVDESWGTLRIDR